MRARLTQVHGVVLVAIVGLVAACGGGGGPTGPGGGGGSGAGSMSASIQGQPWVSDGSSMSVVHGSVPGSLTIQGAKVVSATSYTALSLSLAFIGGPGTYPLGTNVGTTAGGISSVVIQAGSNLDTWITPLDGAAGTVTVTSLTATSISGTFTFVGDSLAGSSTRGTVTVTAGSFNVPLPSGFTTVPVANHGSSLSATLNGFAYNGATVVGLGSGGSFSLSTLTTGTSVSMVTSVLADTTGTYALGNSGIRITVVDLATSHVWGGLAGDAGTVAITSLANGRVVGTFSGTLAPGIGSPGPMTVAGGTFDVRLDTP